MSSTSCDMDSKRGSGTTTAAIAMSAIALSSAFLSNTYFFDSDGVYVEIMLVATIVAIALTRRAGAGTKEQKPATTLQKLAIYVQCDIEPEENKLEDTFQQVVRSQPDEIVEESWHECCTGTCVACCSVSISGAEREATPASISEANAAGVAMSAATVSALQELVDDSSVIGFFKHMEDAGFEPSTAVYNMIMVICAGNGDTERAEHNLNRMLQLGAKYDVLSSSALVQKCVDANDLDLKCAIYMSYCALLHASIFVES